MKVILANMGFVLQMTGMFMLIPIAVALGLHTQDAAVALLVSALSFFALGFFLNAMCERKELTFKQSNGLIALAFSGLSIIGALPYFITTFSDQTLWLRITNSLFESVSGFTTTGFSVITNVSALPESIHIYRSLTQFVGGIGIVLLLLMLFYPEEKLKSLAKSLGLDHNERIKKTFAIIVLVYLLSGLVAIIGALLTHSGSLLEIISYIFAALSTGGFSPVTDSTTALSSTLGYWVIFAMLLGATNFFVITNIVRFKFNRVINSELPLFIFILFSASLIIHYAAGLSWYHSIFQVISASSTTGFATVQLNSVSQVTHWTLIILMFIGGMTISTAGGIRIMRLLVLIKSIPFTIKKIMANSQSSFYLFGREYKIIELMYILLTIILSIFLIAVGSLIVHTQNFSLDDSIFEVISALTCTGLSVGIANASMSLSLKWLFILLMLVGRIEIFTLLFAFSGEDENHPDSAHQVLATYRHPVVK